MCIVKICSTIYLSILTKIEFLEKDLYINRKTAAKYLNQLAEKKLLEKVKIGKTNFYINQPLYNLFKEGIPVTQSVEPIKTIIDSKE
jgi:predicted transcriptional regulator